MTETFEVELSDNQAAKVKRASDLTEDTPEQFIRTAVLNRLQAVDNVLQRQAALNRQRGQN